MMNQMGMMGGGSLLTRVAYSWRDEYMTDLYNKPWLQQESFGLLDASLTYTSPSQKIRVSVYGKNLTDEEYFDYAADVGTLDSARWGARHGLMVCGLLISTDYAR